MLDPEVARALLWGPDARRFLAELIECRLLLEVGAVSLAARRIDEAALEQLEIAMEMLVSAPARVPVERGIAELGVHRVLAAASGNLSLASMLSELLAGFEPAAPLLGRRKESVGEHRRILEAVRTREPEAAGEAMRAHLDALAAAVARGRSRIAALAGRASARR